MTTLISDQLQERLVALAAAQGTDLETLLSAYVERAEHFPAGVTPLAFIEESPALMCIVGSCGCFKYVNQALCDALGYDEVTLLAQPYSAFLHPDDIAITQQTVQTVLSGQWVSHFDNRYRHRDGSYRWLSWKVRVMGDHLYAVAVDITVQREVESQLADVLAENERILSTVFHGYLLGDRRGKILAVNRTYCEMTGYSHEELIQKNIMDLDIGMNPEKVKKVLSPQLEEIGSTVFETQHRHKDGHAVELEVNVIARPDGLLVCFLRDISERKQLEAQIRRSEKMYRGLVESQIDLVCRYTPDTKLTYVNEAYCTYFGKSREELIGYTFLTMASEESRNDIEARLAQLRVDPKPEVRIYPNQHADGGTRWMQWVDYGITDDAGNLTEIQAVGHDITPLITAQEQLTEREEMMATILANIPVMVGQFDPQGRFEYVNQHWVDVLGWTVDEMREHPDIMTAFYPDPDYRQQAIEYMLSAEPGWRDFRTTTKNGGIVDTTWANVKLSDGRSIGIGQVITQRVELENQRVYAAQLEAELEKERELLALKDRFMSLISHEFRTPLAVMNSSLELVTRYYDRLSPERVREKLDGIKYQIMEMVGLIEDTLSFSRSRAGKVTFQPQAVHLKLLCREIIETLKLTDDHQHPIHLHCDEGVLQADPRLLRHIFQNLIGNALKYSPVNTPVTITAKRDEQGWKIAVSDEGIGIPEEDLPLLFEPFHRGSNAHRYSGTGFGLAIVKDYVELHGGSVTVASEPGNGSTFTVDLPDLNAISS